MIKQPQPAGEDDGYANPDDYVDRMGRYYSSAYVAANQPWVQQLPFEEWLARRSVGEMKRNEQSTAFAESCPPVLIIGAGDGPGTPDVRSAANSDGITIGGLGMREFIERRWYGLRRFVWWVFVDDGYKCE